MNSQLKIPSCLPKKLLNWTVYFDVDSLFTNITLEESITICTKSIYIQNDTVKGLFKFEFEKPLYLAMKEPYFF